MIETHSTEVTLEPADVTRLALLCGPLNEHIQLIESCLDVDINMRGAHCLITGEQAATERAKRVLEKLYNATHKLEPLQLSEIKLLITSIDFSEQHQAKNMRIQALHSAIRPRTQNQMDYLESLLK